MANVIWQLQARDVFPLGCHDPRNHVSLPSKTGPRGTLAPWSSGGAGRAGDLPFSRGALRSSGFGLPTSGPAPPGHAGRRKSRAPGPRHVPRSHHGPARRRQPRPLERVDADPRPLGVLRRRGLEVRGAGRPVPPAGLRGRRRRRQGPAPPAVPLRAGHARLGQAGGQGHRGRHLGAGHRAGPRPGRRDRPGRPLRGLRRGRSPGQPGGRLRRGVHLLRGPQLAARPSPLGRGGRPLRAPGRLLLHRRGPPVRLDLRRRRHGHRAAPPLPLLAVPGPAGVPQRRVLRGPRRPRGGAVRVRLAAQHGRDHHLAGGGRAAHRVPPRASLGPLEDVPVHGRDRALLRRLAAARARRRAPAAAVLAQGHQSRSATSRDPPGPSWPPRPCCAGRPAPPGSRGS